MTDGPTATLMDVARSYLSGLDDAARMDNQAAVERFVRWCGADRTWPELRGHEVATYADTLTGPVTGATARAHAATQFLPAPHNAGPPPTTPAAIMTAAILGVSFSPRPKLNAPALSRCATSSVRCASTPANRPT